MPSPKVQLAIVLIGAVAAIIKLVLQHRAALEMKRAEKEAREELAREQAAAAERAARHARESAEREAEREQKEKLFAALQSQSARTLAILETELKVTQETSNRAFDLLKANTDATQELARGLSLTNERLNSIANGAGCRAVGGRPA